jgi:hypothetical protein
MSLHSHWPLIPSSWIKYVVHDIKGVWNPATGLFGLTEVTPHANSPQVCTVVQRGALRGRCFHQPGQPPVIVPGSTLYQALWDECVTEAAGTRIAQGGGIPLLPVNPSIGVANGKLPITHFDTSAEPSEFGPFFWKRWIHNVGGNVDGWRDTVYVTLAENDPVTVVISYIFARGIGPVIYWRGVIQPGGTLKGTRHYCVDNGL